MPTSGRALSRISPLVLAVAACAYAHNAAADEAEGFHFGSYGRVRAATDMRGGGSQYSNIVAHGSRLELPPYLELELRNTQYADKDKNVRVRVVTTLAAAGDPFHYTGKWDSQTALRNMFVDVKGVGHKNLVLWAGSRMYRGDDIYLLDFWPLDNLNTLGGGAIFDATSSTRIQAHVGMNRMLDGAFQYQQRQLPSRTGLGGVATATLDRPRTIASAKITQFFPSNTASKGFKLSLHGEGHFLASGNIETSTTQIEPTRSLPSDNGFVIGAQGTTFGFGDRDGFVHLFARYAKGIAAYGDLSVPFGLDEKNKSSKASEFLLAAASNFQVNRFGVMTGAYLRRFRDASDATFSPNFYWEGILAVRPQVYTSEHTGIATELSYQYKNANVLDDDGKHRVPQIFRASVMPFVTPHGWGAYRRPMLYLLYTASMRNDDARRLYPADDARAQRSTEHYLGLGAEWWFNSTSYQ